MLFLFISFKILYFVKVVIRWSILTFLFQEESAILISILFHLIFVKVYPIIFMETLQFRFLQNLCFSNFSFYKIFQIHYFGINLSKIIQTIWNYLFFIQNQTASMYFLNVLGNIFPFFQFLKLFIDFWTSFFISSQTFFVSVPEYSIIIYLLINFFFISFLSKLFFILEIHFYFQLIILIPTILKYFQVFYLIIKILLIDFFLIIIYFFSSYFFTAKINLTHFKYQLDLICLSIFTIYFLYVLGYFRSYFFCLLMLKRQYHSLGFILLHCQQIFLIFSNFLLFIHLHLIISFLFYFRLACLLHDQIPASLVTQFF